MTRQTRDRLIDQVRSTFAGRKIVVVSNREPVVHERTPGGVRVVHPASGMTTALVPVMQACGGVWVAHGSGSADFDVTDARDGIAWPPERPVFRVRRVRLEPEVEDGYYYGFSNEGIWPLCHLAYTAPLFRHSDWRMYERANAAFAACVLDEIGDEPAVVFIQDYHLALVPRMLRQARADLLIAYFWHIPWPNREVMHVLPWREALLDGLLGSDLIGFHAQHHCHNFLETVDRSVEGVVDYDQQRATRRGHGTFVRPFPISIDGLGYLESARRSSFEHLFPELAAKTAGQTMLLGVDRLDYTKGIPHRLRIVETLLETYPELRGKLTFVQIGAPTRGSIGRYAALAKEISDTVGEVNARFEGPAGWRAVHYLPEHHDREQLAALYRRADACLVTSLHDGMNLVAKEYVAAHAGAPGTLLLSKFTGASHELLEACLVNPYDVEGSAAMLLESLRLPDEVRAEAMRRLWERVRAHDVYDWGRAIFRALNDVWRRREATVFPGN